MPYDSNSPFYSYAAPLVGLVGSLISNHLSSNAQKAAEERARNNPDAIAQRSVIEQLTRYGKEAGDEFDILNPKYLEGVNFLSDFWKKILGDDNAAALDALAPQVNARKAQTQANLRLLDFAPRGGGSNEQTANIYSTEYADILDMLANARNDSQSGFMQLTGDIGDRAGKYHETAYKSAASAASLYGRMAENAQAAGQQAGARAGQTAYAVGQSIASILGMLGNLKSGPAKPAPPKIVMPPLPLPSLPPTHVYVPPYGLRP